MDKEKYKLTATKRGRTERKLSFSSITALHKATDEYLLQGYAVSILKDCQHARMNTSTGGWYCSDCGAQWNNKGILVKKGELK